MFDRAEGEVDRYRFNTAADTRTGDPIAGAYGHSLGANYNKMLRPAVVFARAGDARLVVRRESLEDLIRNDL